MAGVYTVTQINSYIKDMFKQDFVLNRVSVKGEVSNCKYHTSGHIYFTLKDSAATMQVIMFSSMASKLDFVIENGMQLVVSGRIDVYERDGKYQLYASNVEKCGEGNLYKKFLELKQYYEDMGYFASEYKRKIPEYSRNIGIVTASTGAAIRDIMNISYRRNPYVKLYLYSAYVQGEQAKYSIVKGIQTLDAMDLDCIIVGRGGGSLEDLWAFNESEVVEAIFASNTPVISAVGHETDFTIADFVADLRAPTPSAAAELAVCDIFSVERRIEDYKKKLYMLMLGRHEQYVNRLNMLKLRLEHNNPVTMIYDSRQRLINLQDKLDNAMKDILTHKRHRLSVLSAKLDGLSPLKNMSVGYSYTQTQDGHNVSSVSAVKNGDNIDIYVKDGIINANVTGTVSYL